MKYFAYGSNMNPQRMKDRGIRFSGRRSAILNDYLLVFSKVSYSYPGYAAANIIPREGKEVEGIIYEIVDEDIQKLDIFENYPRHYGRHIVIVTLVDGIELPVVTYIAQPDIINENLAPHPDYLAHVLQGKDFLSDDYYSFLKAFQEKKIW